MRMGLPYRGPTEGAQFQIDSFGYILYFLCKCSSSQPLAHTVSILGVTPSRTNVSWVKIHCCFVAEESKLDFCSATNRISHESVPLPGSCPERVSVIKLTFCHQEKCEILFVLANPIWDWCTSRLQIWKGDSATALMENSP